MKSKKIEFLPSSKETVELVEEPKSSNLFIPNWYKKIVSSYKKSPQFSLDGKLLNTNLKMCMPFLDALTSGYIQKTWCDIYIEKDNDNVNFTYASTPSIINIRKDKVVETYKDEFYLIEFVWYIQYVPKLPKGYSALICHPLNRMDLPFYTLSGIVDYDMYHHVPNGNLPFYIKKDFEGLIPKGTPMYQIIPFKRDSWISIKNNNEKILEKNNKLQRSFFWEFYKKNMWQKKKYE
jgi:hypothetical protein